MKTWYSKIFTAAAFFLLFTIGLSAQENQKVFSDSLLSLCKKYFNESSYKKAITLYDNKSFDKLSGEELYYLGLSYNGLHDLQRAVRYFKGAAASTPQITGYKIQLARTLNQLSKTGEAQNIYKQIIEIEQLNVTALYELGLIYVARQKYDDAIPIFQKLIEINRDDFLSNYYLAYAIQNSDKQLDPQKYLEICLSINPEFAPAMDLLGWNLLTNKKYPHALSLFNLAKSLYPGNSDFHYKSGLCYEKMSNFRDAAKCFQKSILLDASNPFYRDHLGFAFFQLGVFDSSITAYKEAIHLDPKNPSHYMNLGYVYAKTDSVKKSIESFTKALDLFPQNKMAEIYNQIAAINYSKNNFKEAKATYEHALLFSPNNADTQFYLALINDKLTDYKNASLRYKKFIELAADDSLLTGKLDFATKRIKELKRR